MLHVQEIELLHATVLHSRDGMSEHREKLTLPPDLLQRMSEEQQQQKAVCWGVMKSVSAKKADGGWVWLHHHRKIPETLLGTATRLQPALTDARLV